MPIQSFEDYEFLLEHLRASMKALDDIEQENPVEEHIKAGYAELDKAYTVAKRLQAMAPYLDEED